MEIKGYTSGDEKQILELFSNCFNKPMGSEYWNWRFLNNPFTNKVYIDLMWNGEKLVGHYAVSPIELLIDNKIKLSALSMTTMTHPDYGGQGIFTKLANSLYQKLSDNNYNLVWGFPNNNSHYGFIKNLEWQNLAIQSSMSLDASLVKKNRNASIIEFTNFDNLTNLFNSSNKKVKINKSTQYLNWRYVTNPAVDYKIILNKNHKAGLVYKKINAFKDNSKFEIDIMELFHDDTIESMIDLLCFILEKERDICQFNIWDALFSENQLFLEKMGFRLNAHSTYMGYRDFSKTAYIDDYKNWDISYGYSDVF